MRIRKAVKKDLEQIFKIYNHVKLDRSKIGDNHYSAEIQKKGFLLGLDSMGTFTKELGIAYNFLVAEDDDKIVGYLIADHSKEEKFYDDEYKTWFDQKIKEFYYNDPKGMTIASIAVDPEYSGHGVATELLKFLKNNLIQENYKYLFSIITIAPLTNCPTIIWHTKNGFERLATGRPRRLFELDNYSGVLLYKKLF